MNLSLNIIILASFLVASTLAESPRPFSSKSFLSLPLTRGILTNHSSSHILAKRHSDRINAARLLTGSSETVPIFGDFRRLAYFYADLFVGSTSQKFSVIADTGSSLTAVPCKTCTDCGLHQNPKYDPLSSSSATKLACSGGSCPGVGRCDADNQCGYSMSYAEGSSLNGKLWRDNVYLGGASAGGSPAELAFPFVLGCGQHEGGLFTTQDADGIMGLGQADENSAIMRAMWKSGVLSSNIFSLCLSFSGGALTVGGVDSRLHYAYSTSPSSSPPRMLKESSLMRNQRRLHGDGAASPGPLIPTTTRWAQMTIPGFYEVSVKSVVMDKSSINIPHDGFSSPRTILDSGTTFTYIPHLAYEALRQAITSYCMVDSLSRCVGQSASVQNEPLCYRLDEPGDLSTFPTLTIELLGHNNGPNVFLTIPPQNLFVNMGWDSGAHCLAVYDNGNNGGVIGANAMMGNDVIFDLSANTPRVGFAESSECQVYVPPPPPTSTATATVTPSVTPTISSSSAAVVQSPSVSANATQIPPLANVSGIVTATLTATATVSVTTSLIPSPLPPSDSPVPSKLPPSQSQSPRPSSSSAVAPPSGSQSSSSPSPTTSSKGPSDPTALDSASPLDGGSVSIDSTSLFTIVLVSVVAGMIACFLLAVCCATIRSRISFAGLVITKQSASAGGYKKVGRKAAPGEGVVLDGGAKIGDDDDEDDEDITEKKENEDDEERVNLVESSSSKQLQQQRSVLSSNKVTSTIASSSMAASKGSKSSLPSSSSSSLSIQRKPISLSSINNNKNNNFEDDDDDEGWDNDEMEDLDDNVNINQSGVNGSDKGSYKDKPITANPPHPALVNTANSTNTTSKPSSKMTLGKKASTTSNTISVSINK
jgi:hypothetical protein